ncbi:MAG: TIGR03905 family TSCPD domain-containing protein [Butyrivibrio sp.]|nr:TIGR03905 family TSCPD domain-containing protein [Butyrivibrio sp.]
MMTYKTKGTCSTQIDLDVVDGIVKNVKFTNGCNGNLQGISRLVEGMKAEDAISKLRGIKCGFKNTSCPDQLSYAIEQAMAN